MEVVEVERILLILKGLGFSQTSEETIKMMLGTQSFDLVEHDKQIRTDAIDDFVHECDKCCGFYSGKNKSITREDILKIAEQLKERE